MNIKQFNEYKKKMRAIIKHEYTKPRNNSPSKDILDEEEDRILSLISLKITQNYMIRGKIWQEAIGMYGTCINLDKTKYKVFYGIDIINHENKLAIELKNKYNTTNSKGLKSLRDKLAKIKLSRPDYRAIHGIINGKDLKSYRKIITHEYNGEEVELEELVGMKLFKTVFGNDCNRILKFIKTEVKKYHDAAKILEFIQDNC